MGLVEGRRRRQGSVHDAYRTFFIGISDHLHGADRDDIRSHRRKRNKAVQSSRHLDALYSIAIAFVGQTRSNILRTQSASPAKKSRSVQITPALERAIHKGVACLLPGGEVEASMQACC